MRPDYGTEYNGSLFTLSVYELSVDLWVLFKCPFELFNTKSMHFVANISLFFFFNFSICSWTGESMGTFD